LFTTSPEKTQDPIQELPLICEVNIFHRKANFLDCVKAPHIMTTDLKDQAKCLVNHGATMYTEADELKDLIATNRKSLEQVEAQIAELQRKHQLELDTLQRRREAIIGQIDRDKASLERATAPLIRPQPKGVNINGWDI
jgi:hypothetical protein